MHIREAEARDWPLVWPFFRQIVAAAETYPYDPDIGETAARDLWMLEPPGRTVVVTDDAGRILGTA